MVTLNSILLIMLASVSLISCAKGSKENRIPMLYNSQSEAEKASVHFNCTGAHKMGDKWMPCKIHKVHEKDKKESGYGHNHHNH